MTEEAHALISPSSRYRNLVCVGSLAQIKRTNSKSVTSPYAAEGTLAHDWIKKALTTIHSMKEFDFNQIPDEEMRGHVVGYCAFIGEINKNFRKTHQGVQYYIEQKVKYNDDWWGTLDYALTGFNMKTMRFCAVICDFKYGRGVEVSAEDNEQLMDYILCFQEQLKKNFAEAHCFIFQPRTPGKEFTRWSVDEHVIQTCKDRVLRNNEAVLSFYYAVDDMPTEGSLIDYLKAGEHCRFCPAKYKCEAFLENANDSKLAILNEVPEIPVVKELTLEQKLAIFERRKVIKKILDDVASDLLTQANKGTKIPGWKIVQRAGKRRWKHGDDTVFMDIALKGKGVENPLKVTVIGLGEVEKQIGKGKIDDLTELTPGGYELVPESDKRTEVQSIGLSELTEIDFEG